MAVGLIGGLFDLIIDFIADDDPARLADADQLIADLTDFYLVVRSELVSALTRPPPVRPSRGRYRRRR